MQQDAHDARFDPDHHEPRVGRYLRQRGVRGKGLGLAAAVPQAGAERFVAHQFTQFGLVFQAHLKRGVLRVESAARTPDDGVPLSDGGEFQEYESRQYQQDAGDDDLDVARHHDECRVADERHGQGAARSGNQHAVAGRCRHEQQVGFNPRVAVVERRDGEYDHRKSHRGPEVGGVAEEREIAHAAADDVRRSPSEHEQPVVLRGVEAYEFLDAGFRDGDQRQ